MIEWGRRRALAAVALAVVALVAVAGCGGDGDAGTTSVGTEVSSQASSAPSPSTGDVEVPSTGSASPIDDVDRDGELRVGYVTGFNGFDPHRTVQASSSAPFMRPVYDTLLAVVGGESSLELGPQLATSYEVAEDGLRIDFELRDDVSFQDGTKFNAAAVKANIERAKDEQSTVASTISSLERVEVIDDTHVVFHLSRPDPSVLWAMGYGSTGMMISPSAFDTDLMTKPVGSGPFVLASAVKDGDSVYERWERHWDPDAALVQRLVISTITDNIVRYNGLRTGEYHVTYLAPPVDVEGKSLEADGYHYRLVSTSFTYGVLLNAAKPPLDDVRVRKAISLALDRELISEQLTGGISPAVSQVFTEGYVGHDESLVEAFDPDEARRLVEEAGATGAALTVIQQTSTPQDLMAEVVQQALGDIGLNVEVTPFSPTEARPTWREGGYHALVALIGGRPDPGLWLEESYLGTDNPAESPAELVQMAKEALILPLGSAERDAAYREIAAYLFDSPVHVQLSQWGIVTVARPEVVGSENLIPAQGELSIIDFRGVGIAAS